MTPSLSHETLTYGDRSDPYPDESTKPCGCLCDIWGHADSDSCQEAGTAEVKLISQPFGLVLVRVCPSCEEAIVARLARKSGVQAK